MIRTIQKESLRDKAADELLRLIVSARLRPGSVLSSVELARRMGISRTPVREALQRLEKDGFVVSDASGGFRVPELRSDEAKNIYELRAELEPLALRLAGPPPAGTAQELERINTRLKSVRAAADLIRLDEKWHRRLVEHCPNEILLGYIINLHRLSRRYEYAYMASSSGVRPSLDQHDDILAALEKHDLGAACQKLNQNMLVGLPGILKWLDDGD